MQITVTFATAGPPPPDLRARADAARKRIREAVQTLSCPVHGRGPQITLTCSAAGRFQVSVSGCCATFARRVKWRVEDRFPEAD